MENSWLDEWIRYHHGLGVEHFILFNDDDDTRVSDRILEPYIKQGFLENIHVRDLFGTVREDRLWRQKDVYREMIRRSVGQTTWLAIIDLDEFILPRPYDDLRELLAGYEEHAGLAMNWCIYGANGHVKRPSTQINHLLHHSDPNWEANKFVKSIVRPEKVILDRIYDVHHFPTEGGDTVNENHEPVHKITHDVSTEKIRVNHYVLRSWQDFWEVKAARPRFNGCGSFNEEYFHFHDRNEVFDDEISRRFGHVLKDRVSFPENQRVEIPNLEINVVLGCNLKCEYCSHFGRYMKGIVPLEELVQWYETWSPKIIPKTVKLLGGEPLLHPDMTSVLEETRRLWPDSRIELVTNGLPAPMTDQRLFFTICKHDVHVVISRHFDDPHYNRIFTQAIETFRMAGIEPHITQSNLYWTKYYRMDDQGKPVPYQSDPQKAWNNCYVKNQCTTLMDNKLYRCPQLGCGTHARQKRELSDAWDTVLEYRPLLPDCTSGDIREFIHAGACEQCGICPETFEYTDMYEKINPFGLYSIEKMQTGGGGAG